MKINNYKLNPFSPLEIVPKGWIKHQLETQIQGLSGHLQDFWPDIKDSKYVGGNCEGWERVPYWLDGVVPLAYLLKDQHMIEVVNHYVDKMIENQQEDGWIAPCSLSEREKYDVWGVFIILKPLTQLYDLTHNEKILNAIYRAIKNLKSHIEKYPLFDWAKMRWYEPVISVIWLYNIKPEEWMIDLIKLLEKQGFDYYSFDHQEEIKTPTKRDKWNQFTHVVNNCMSVKAYALCSLLSKKMEDIEKSNFVLDELTKYNGTIHGAINGDECLSGLDPRRGSELCSIVELMYSLEILNQITASSRYQERLERLAFNALPSTMTNDMWAHQYVNSVNQPFIKENEERLWNTNGPEANLYGLEPNFGCCTANMHQGWPKFVLSSVLQNNDVVRFNSYIPLSIKNKDYEIDVDSFYPFKKDIVLKIRTKKPLTIEFLIPHWSVSTVINGKTYANKDIVSYKVKDTETTIALSFSSIPSFVETYGGLSLVDGPLVYALKVNSKLVQVHQNVQGREYPHCDYEIHNLSKFNYGLMNKDYSLLVNKVDENQSPFVNELAPLSYMVKCVEIDYLTKGNYVEFNPCVVLGEKECEFVPIGLSKLRIGVLPIVSK